MPRQLVGQPVRHASVQRRTPVMERGSAVQSPPAASAPPQTPPIVTRGFVNLDQYLFAILLAARTGLSPRVTIAWIHAEEPASANPSERGHNWLNVGVGSPGGPKGAGYGWSGIKLKGTGNPGYTFNSTNDAVTETAWWINNMSNFATIKRSAGESDANQLSTIAMSPWDASHYGGGANLTGSYNAETGAGGSSALGNVSGWLSSAGSAAGGIATAGGALNPINDIIDAGKAGISTAKFLGILTEKSFWIRTAFVMIGLVFGVVGLIFLFESTSFGKSVTQSAGSAAMMAA